MASLANPRWLPLLVVLVGLPTAASPRDLPAGTKCARASTLALAAFAGAAPETSGPVEARLRPGSTAYRAGRLDEAAAHWLAAAEQLAAEGDAAGQAEALARAAEARAALGQLAESRTLLARALELALEAGDATRTGAILGALARTDLELGDAKRARDEIDEALSRARAANAPRLEAAILHGRGELLAEHGDTEAALGDFQLAARRANEAGDAQLAAQANAMAGRTALEAGRTEGVAGWLSAAGSRARAAPDSDAVAQLLIHIGASYEIWVGLEAAAAPQATTAAADAFGAALGVAERAGARRSESFALVRLGGLYERAGRTDEALALTRRSLAAARSADAPGALYRAHWQLARLQRAQGDVEASLSAYRRAVDTLAELRAGSGGLAFAEAAEPVLFGLVDLLLQQASRATEPDRRTALLREARDQLEELKSAELVEYFQDACLAPQIETRVEEIPGAVVVYPVLLPDRTEFIVSRGEAIENVVIPISAGELEPRIHRLRALLQKRTTRQYRPAAADLYDVLMRPLLNTLGDAPVDALVFVPGGALRTIPMGALYDRQERRFLVEKYPLAVIPALKLTDPRPLDRERVRTLSAGLTLPVQGFPALMSVQSEIIAVDEIFEGRSLMDDEFVLDAVEQSLGDDQYDIVHIATHGQFRARASDSFLLTYDGKLSLDRLAVLVERTRYRDRPIELLTLSACETAVGDDRAALGLAGVAVRAGARSALATLWTVNDQAAADLIAEFYRQLSLPEVSKAVALQRAQIKLLESRPYGHPGYWAPFLLISNWM